jgi:nitrogen-specific signal transduction histidine kinase/CheY-like chemotaxis protein
MGGAVFRVVAEEERRGLEAQVQHAQKLESLGVLCGGIAHDFNNLLMGILGNASMVLEDLPTESPARPGVNDIEHTAKLAADLVRQLLAYSGKVKFVVERIRLSALVAEMVHLLEISITKNARLRLDLDETAPAVEVDATQVRQVLVNLITNASEALGGEDGVVSIRTGVTECDRQYLRETYLDDELAEGLYSHVEVSDTGCGMDRKTLSRIFDPFFTSKFTGRGLGLAAVLGIVRSHRGAIKVYSEPGQGTSFKVLFPAVAAKPVTARPPTDEAPRLDGTGQTVLVVDDEESVRRVAGRMLARCGFEVVVAKDGQEALELVRSAPERFALVLLDLTMPKMGGEACFRELRALNPELRVILSSGHNEQELTARFAGKGLAGFIQKPYQKSSLEKVVRDVLARR